MRKFLEDVYLDLTIICAFWIAWYMIVGDDVRRAAFFCIAALAALTSYLALRFTRKEEKYDG